MSATGIMGLAQLPTGRWPDQISFDRTLDTYLWSEGSTRQIQVLDHIHVVNYDQDGGGPYTMTLQLPIIENLPTGGRMYFFYVSRDHLGDSLIFDPVPLSGNTVNGLLGPFSFTLSGAKTLFVCIGFHGNYVIHPINTNITPAVGASIPMVNFHYDELVEPLYGPIVTDDFSGTASDAFPGIGGFNPEVVVIPGMEGFVLPNQAVPTQAFEGFLCTQDGIYAVNPILFFVFSYLRGGALGGLWGSLYEMDPAGALTYAQHAPAFVPFLPPAGELTNFQEAFNTTMYVQLLAGFYYVFAFGFEGTGGTIQPSTINGGITFQYWAPLPVIPPPLLALRSAAPVKGPARSMFQALAKSASSSSSAAAPKLADNEVIMGSAEDTTDKRKALHKKLIDDDKSSNERARMSNLQKMAAMGSSSSSSSSSVPTSMSLSDVENIVRHIMRSTSQSQVVTPAPAPPAVVVSTPAPPAKKRARTSGHETE